MTYEVRVACNPMKLDDATKRFYVHLVEEHAIGYTLDGKNSRITGIPDEKIADVLAHLEQEEIGIIETRRYHFVR